MIKRCLFIALMMFSWSVLAEPASEVENLFNEASILYKAQDYTNALAKFQEAYKQQPSAELLFNIAQCYRLLGRYEEALRAYRSFISDSKDETLSLSASARIKEIEELLASTGSLQLSSSQDPAQVYLDGVKKSLTPLTLKDIPIGPHTLKLEKEGFVPYEERIEIKAQQTYALKIPLSPEEPPPTFIVPGLLGGASAVSSAGFLFMLATREKRDSAFEGKAMGMLAVTADLTLLGALASGVYVGVQRSRSR